MNKCTKNLHVDMPLFIGSMLIRMRRYLDELPLFGIYPNLNDNETMVDMLDVAYIQPIFHIFKEYLSCQTGHPVSFRGDGQTNLIEFEDTGAIFKYEILEYGDTDVPFYYDNASDDEAQQIIYLLETIYTTHRFLNIGEVAEQKQRETKEWLDSIRENTDDDYTEEDDEALWMEYMSEIHEGFEEWKARKKSKGPDIKAGTIAWYDGKAWKQLTGINNVEVTVDEPESFYADDVIYYQQPTYEFSFTCEQLSDAFKDFANDLTASLKKSQDNSVPP